MKETFETLVVGSGPAGIAAAVCAAEHGNRVGLVDDNPNAGGQIWRKPPVNPEHSHQGISKQWFDRLITAPMTRLQGWSIVDKTDANTLRAQRGESFLDLQYGNLILATGARERFLPFPGWTLPNVMGIGGIQAMVKSGLPVLGKRIVLAGSGPLLLAVSYFLKSSGAHVICICEQASISELLPFAFSLASTPGKIVEGIQYKSATLGIPFHTSAWVVEAKGDSQLQTVTVSIGGKLKSIACDYLGCAFGLVPNTELAAVLGCSIHAGAVTVDEWQRTSEPSVFCAGEPTGIGGLELALIEGQISGLIAVDQKQKAEMLFQQRDRFRRFALRMAKAFALRPELKKLPSEDTLLCRCEDVTYGAASVHHSWRAAKLQTRCGMGPCQGRICGSASEFLFGWEGISSVRPPIFPALVSNLVSAREDKQTGTTTA